MQNLALIGTIALLHILAAISPGPDFILTIKNSITYSRKTGIYTALGIALGISIHIFYCLAGLALIISKSILIFNTIKFIGAGYLIYIGIKSFKSKAEKAIINKEIKKTDISPFSAIKMGFLTNILNPKVTLFFLSLFTMVISPETPPTILGIASTIMIINTAIWFSLVAILFTQSKVRSFFDKFQNAFNKSFGAILVALGIKVAFIEK